MACAILETYFANQGYRTRVIRSRDPGVWERGDVVFDVGGVYDPNTNRFDHHQTGGAGARSNTIPYSSVGLVWKKFGPEICAPCEQLVEKIDSEIIKYIDAGDNGFDIKNHDSNAFTAFTPIFYMIDNSTWKEKTDEEDCDDLARFKSAVAKAKTFFGRYLEIARVSLEASERIKKTYQSAEDKKILTFDTNFTRTVFVANLVNFPEPLLHIYPDRSGSYSIETIPASFGSFEKRISFPAAWAGLSGEKLQEVSGISDITFCHNGRFLCKTKTLKGAKLLAEKVVYNR